MRILRRKLIAPMFSTRRPPEFTAWSVAVGVFWAFTPLVGAQLALIFAFWALVKSFAPRFDFNPIVACAWVWVTNVFTLGPIYYGFVLTGQFLLGRSGEDRGYDAFRGRLDEMLAANPDANFVERLWLGTVSVLDAFGLPLFVGCLPWAIGLSWISYVWALRLVRRRLERREIRLRQRREQIREAAQRA